MLHNWLIHSFYMSAHTHVHTHTHTHNHSHTHSHTYTHTHTHTHTHIHTCTHTNIRTHITRAHTQCLIVCCNFYQHHAYIRVVQEIDGETLCSMGQYGTTDQMRECGLVNVRDQLKLKKMIVTSTVTNQPSVATPNTKGFANANSSVPILGT